MKIEQYGSRQFLSSYLQLVSIFDMTSPFIKGISDLPRGYRNDTDNDIRLRPRPNSSYGVKVTPVVFSKGTPRGFGLSEGQILAEVSH